MINSATINQRLNGGSPLSIEHSTRCNIYWTAPLVASLAASAAGTGLSIAAQEKSQAAQRSVANEELQRQQAYQKKAQDAVNTSLQQSTRDVADKQIQEGADQHTAAYERVGGLSAPNAGAPTTTATMSSPTARGSAASDHTASKIAAAWNKIVAPSQARMGGYGDWGLKQDQKNARTSDEIGLQGSNAKGSYRVNQFEQADAAHSGDTMAGIGSILSALGSVGGMYAATTPTAAAARIPAANVPGSTWNRILSGYPTSARATY